MRDFTQILCRYLPKKLAAGTSGRDIDHLEEAEDVDQPGDAQAKEHLPGSFQSAFFSFLSHINQYGIHIVDHYLQKCNKDDESGGGFCTLFVKRAHIRHIGFPPKMA